MQMVVVVDERRHDPPGAAEACVWADEDLHGARADEAVHQRLSEPTIVLAYSRGCKLLPVTARVVHVDVEPTLVRGMSDPAEARTEVAAARPAEIADSHPGCVGIRG